MATRYEDRDYDRGTQNYGRRRNPEYGRFNEGRSQARSRFDRDEGERYAVEDRWRADYGSRYPSRSGREYQSGREEYGAGDWENERDYYGERERGYGAYGRGYDAERRYGDASNIPSQRYNYPTGFRSGETYGGHGAYEDAGRYGRRAGRSYEYDRDYGLEEERGWWDRASDEVASWFGDEEAGRRRRIDQQRAEFRGRGPKGYRRSDERIKEDVNDRLSEGYLDASDVEVAVQNTEVTLTGTVYSRVDKRRAEAIADSVTGVTNVENRLRVKQSEYGRYDSIETTGTTGTTGASTSATGTMSSKRASTGS
jgi:osmotically-inducible protein OsmY